MNKLKIEYLPIDKLTPYEKNAKQHPKEQIEQIKKSISDFEMIDPIGVWGKKNIIVEGHGRLIACKELGFAEVPVIRLDHLTDAERKAYTLAHNKTTMNSDFDADILFEELKNLAEEGFDMSDFGFDDFDFNIEEDDTEVEEDYYEPEIPEEPKAKLGDIYQLGNHRLMCGSSTEEADVEELIDGEEMDLCLTDPPYNVNYENKVGKIENDNMGDPQFHEFLYNFYSLMLRSLKPGGAFYIWHADSEGYNFRSALQEAGGTVRQCLIWNKNSLVLGRQDYHWKHEPCLYGWKAGAGHYYIDDRSQTTVFEDKIDIDKLTKDQMKEILKEIFEDRVSTTVMNEAKPLANDLHPTMKPIKLMGRLIKNSSRPGEKVVDFFGGSGSTLIACEQLNRKCYMMEYDPKYVDVIIDRWEQLTGQKAELIKRRA